MEFSEKFQKEIEQQNFTDEQLEWLYKKFVKRVLYKNGYKINVGNKCYCYKSTFNGHDFYKIYLEKKDMDGEKIKAYKNVRFVGCEPPELEKCEIIIDSMFEDFYFKKNDIYNPIFTLVVTDYHYPKNSGAYTYQGISEYIDNVDYLKDDSFDITGEAVNEIEEDFPF